MAGALPRTLAVVLALVLPAPTATRPIEQPPERAPAFERDASWPRPLPDDWALGIVWAVSVDSRDHVWVLHAADRYLEEMADAGKVPAPPVVEFDPEGNLVQAWAGATGGNRGPTAWSPTRSSASTACTSTTATTSG